MKTIACKEYVPGCQFVAKGETEEAAAKQLLEHMEKNHMEELKNMMRNSSREQLMSEMKKKAKEEEEEWEEGM